MVVLGAAIVSVLQFLLIPLTQILDPVKKVDLLIREVVLAPPPPNVPPPPPDDSEPLPEPPPPELVQVPPPITINALDIDLNAGTGDAIAIGVPSPDLVMQEVAQEIERMFTFDDLPEKRIPLVADADVPRRAERERLAAHDRHVRFAGERHVAPSALVVLALDAEVDRLLQAQADVLAVRHPVDLGEEQGGERVAVHPRPASGLESAVGRVLEEVVDAATQCVAEAPAVGEVAA